MIAEKAVQQREKVDLTFRQGAKDCVPTLLGYISIGLAGIVGVSSHLSVMEVTLLSALVYAGAKTVYYLCTHGCKQFDFSYYSHNIHR